MSNYDRELGESLLEFQGPLEEGKEWDSLNPPTQPPLDIPDVAPPPRAIDPIYHDLPALPQGEYGGGGPEGGYGGGPAPVQSRTWPVQTPNFIDPSTFPEISAPPENEYSFAQKLLYGLKTLGNRAAYGFSQGREGISNYMQKRMPKIYRNRYAYRGDEPVRGPEGGHMYERQQVGLRNPLTMSKIDPYTDQMGDYNWLERALMMDMDLRSPVREIGDPMINYDFSDKK